MKEQRRKMIRESRRVVVLIISICILALSGQVMAGEKVGLIIGGLYMTKLSNDNDEYVCFRYSDEQPTGNMELYYNDEEIDKSGNSTGLHKLVVKKFNNYRFESISGDCFNDFYVEAQYGERAPNYVHVKMADAISIGDNQVIIYGEKDSTCRYSLGLYNKQSEKCYNIEGKMIGTAAFENKGDCINVSQLEGVITVAVCDKNNDKTFAEGKYYLFNQKIRISMKGKKIIVKSGLVIPKRITKNITSLYLRPANRGKNMFLSWNRVRGAKSYIVYRYSPVKNEYVKVAIRDSQNANYYNIPKADSAIGYKYKVVAKSKGEGKGKKVCKDSYAVWAVAAGNAKGNVTSITPNKKKVTGKAGKSIRLTAKVATGERLAAGTTKKVLSKTIRWYSSNKKIARINKQTGKVKFLRKGKCFIWAKAHNGKNSRKIKVVVK